MKCATPLAGPPDFSQADVGGALVFGAGVMLTGLTPTLCPRGRRWGAHVSAFVCFDDSRNVYVSVIIITLPRV